VDAIRSGEIQLIINTPRGSTAHADGSLIRGAAVAYGVPMMTTLTGATAAVQGIRSVREKTLRVRSLQTHHTV
jgi:carbamoyl-phosphate synthase large subunit